MTFNVDVEKQFFDGVGCNVEQPVQSYPFCPPCLKSPILYMYTFFNNMLNEPSGSGLKIASTILVFY